VGRMPDLALEQIAQVEQSLEHNCQVLAFHQDHRGTSTAHCSQAVLRETIERDEEAELDQFGDREVAVKLGPQGIVGDVGIPDDCACIGERRLLPGAEFFRVGEVQQLVVLLFGEALPSSLDGALDASIFAIDGFGHINPAQFLERVIHDAVAKRQFPCLGEGPEYIRVVRPDRLALGPGRPFATAPLQLLKHRGIGDRRRIGVGDALFGHRTLLAIGSSRSKRSNS